MALFNTIRIAHEAAVEHRDLALPEVAELLTTAEREASAALSKLAAGIRDERTRSSFTFGDEH